MIQTPLHESRGRRQALARMEVIAAGSLVVAAVLILLLAWKPRQASDKRPLTVFCAAGLHVPLERLAAQYEQQYGVKVQINYGASETLYTQLDLAASADLFISADERYVKMGQQRRLIRESIPLATMQPVIAVARGNPRNIRTLDDLLRPDVRVAVANPEAAIGLFMRTLLQSAGRWPTLEARVRAAGSFHTTVVEVANAVKAGTKADAGIVWDATVAQIPQLEAVHVPELDAGLTHVTVGVLENSRDPASALRFARFVTARDRGLPVLRESGYTVDQGDKWEFAPTVTLFSGAVNKIAIDETIGEFERREGATVNRIFAGCGTLVADMKAIRKGDVPKGFPDAYMACDVSFVTPVQQWFHAPVSVSETDMVLITRKGNPLGLRGLDDLARAGLKVGLADPEKSTLGVLTQRLLTARGVLDAVQKNVNFTSPTADMLALELVEGKLDAAVVYQANTTRQRGRLEVLSLSDPGALAVQPFAVARDSEHAQLAGRLRQAIVSATSRQRFEAAGFRWRAAIGGPLTAHSSHSPESAPPGPPPELGRGAGPLALTPAPAPRGRADLFFFAALGALGGTYVVLIVALLLTDTAYTSFHHIGAALGKVAIRDAIRLSLESSSLAAILSLWVAVPLGYLMSRYRFPGRALLDAVIDIPIVLPPLVVGLSLLILFQFRPFRWVSDWVVYEWPAVVLAQFTVGAAFAIRTMRATFDLIDRRREDVALTLGCGRAQAFWMVVLPEARRGMVTAGTLVWARALGEFGPILVFAGATRGKTEVFSTSVYLELTAGDLEAAVAVSMIMILAAVIVLVAARLWGDPELKL